MKTYYKDYGVIASITDVSEGAKLVIKNQYGKKLYDKVHSSRNAALQAWKRMCR